MSISSDADTDMTKESDSQHGSVLDTDVDMRMKGHVHTLDGVVLDGRVNIERDGDDCCTVSGLLNLSIELNSLTLAKCN
jgi:hypothetical protein